MSRKLPGRGRVVAHDYGPPRTAPNPETATVTQLLPSPSGLAFQGLRWPMTTPASSAQNDGPAQFLGAQETRNLSSGLPSEVADSSSRAGLNSRSRAAGTDTASNPFAIRCPAVISRAVLLFPSKYSCVRVAAKTPAPAPSGPDLKTTGQAAQQRL